MPDLDADARRSRTIVVSGGRGPLSRRSSPRRASPPSPPSHPGITAAMLLARGTVRAPDLDTAGGMMLVTCWAAVVIGWCARCTCSRGAAGCGATGDPDEREACEPCALA